MRLSNRAVGVRDLLICANRVGLYSQEVDPLGQALGNANRVGLYSQEVDPLGQALGNFHQAVTHLALVSGAFNLDRALE